MAFKLGMKVDLRMEYMVCFNDVDLDARSQCLSRGKRSTLNYLDN